MTDMNAPWYRGILLRNSPHVTPLVTAAWAWAIAAGDHEVAAMAAGHPDRDGSFDVAAAQHSRAAVRAACAKTSSDAAAVAICARDTAKTVRAATVNRDVIPVEAARILCESSVNVEEMTALAARGAVSHASPQATRRIVAAVPLARLSAHVTANNSNRVFVDAVITRVLDDADTKGMTGKVRRVARDAVHASVDVAVRFCDKAREGHLYPGAVLAVARRGDIPREWAATIVSDYEAVRNNPDTNNVGFRRAWHAHVAEIVIGAVTTADDPEASLRTAIDDTTAGQVVTRVLDCPTIPLTAAAANHYVTLIGEANDGGDFAWADDVAGALYRRIVHGPDAENGSVTHDTVHGRDAATIVWNIATNLTMAQAACPHAGFDADVVRWLTIRALAVSRDRDAFGGLVNLAEAVPPAVVADTIPVRAAVPGVARRQDRDDHAAAEFLARFGAVHARNPALVDRLVGDDTYTGTLADLDVVVDACT